MSKAYEDIGKDAVEFITKGFPNGGTFKCAVETKTPNGVSLKANAARSLEHKKGAYTEKLTSEFEPKWEWKENNAEFSGKASVAGDFEGGISISDVATAGTKVSVTGYQSDKDGMAVKGQLAFKNNQISAKGGAKFPLKPNSHMNCNGELTFRHDNIYAGADIRYDKAMVAATADTTGEKPKPLADRLLYNVKLGYLTDQLQVVAFVEDQLNKEPGATTPIFHTFNMNFLYTLTAAIKLGFGFSVERNNEKPVEISAAGEYKLDRDTSLKGKFSMVAAKNADDKEFRLGLAMKQNVTERVNVTVGADLNTRAILGQGTPGTAGSAPGSTKPHSFGFEVKFQ